jgi:hypothetical protein
LVTDFLNVVATIPADEPFAPLADGASLVGRR